MKKPKQVISIILFIIAMAAPLVALINISNIEQKQYVIENDVQIGEIAYGDICEATRIDLEESLTIDGVIVSGKIEFIELSKYKDSSKIRFIVHEGECIEKGQVIGYYLGNEIFSDKDGVVREIGFGEDCYIMLDSFSELVMKVDCSDEKTYEIINQKKVSLKDEDGNKYHIVRIDKAKDEEGHRYMYLSVDKSLDLTYGTKIEKLELFTGKVYKGVMAVDKDCVYSYNDDKTYVRVISDSGVEEKEIEVGFYSGHVAVVSGIDEGTMCDSGYKTLIEKKDVDDE